MQDLKSLGEQLENLISSKTVIGEPIVIGDVTLVPIIKANFGFGMGGANNDGIKRSGASGGGGGANIMPVAVVVVKGSEVSLLPVNKQESGTWGPLLEKLPQLYEKVVAARKAKSAEADESDESDLE